MSEGRLQKEIGKKKPFELKEEEALLNLYRTSDRLQTMTMRLMREYGLTPAQYNVLRILHGKGKPLPVLEIAEHMIADTPGITGLIDRLEAMVLVERRRCLEDRRVVYVGITSKGTAIVGRLDEPLRELNRRLLGHLSHELTELIRLLEKVRAALADVKE